MIEEQLCVNPCFMSEESYSSGLTTEECVSHGQVHLRELEHIQYSSVFFKVWNQGINLDYFFGTFHCLSFFSYICSQSLHLCSCSVAQSCLTLRDPTDCSTAGLPAPQHLPEFAQVHVHCIGHGIQSSHPLDCIGYSIQSSHPLTPSSSDLNLSQHQGLFQ